MRTFYFNKLVNAYNQEWIQERKRQQNESERIRKKYRKILCRWCKGHIRKHKSFCSIECEIKMKKADARYRLKIGIKLRDKTLNLLNQ